MLEGDRCAQLAVLVVEDDDSMRVSLRRLLQRFLPCVETTSVHEAKRCLRERVAGVLVDVGLPDGSGFEVLEAARESQHRVPAVVYSGTFEPTRVNRAASLGALFVCKPFEPAALQPFVMEAVFASQSLAVRAAAQVARARWSLTAAEVAVLVEALAGGTRDDFVRERSISLNTYKTHVRNLLLKTGHLSIAGLALCLWNEWAASRATAG